MAPGLVNSVEVDVNHFYDLTFPMQISGGKTVLWDVQSSGLGLNVTL